VGPVTRPQRAPSVSVVIYFNRSCDSVLDPGGSPSAKTVLLLFLEICENP